MRAEEVLAVVVSYNGLHKTRQTVDALRGQVGNVHIVDNGSEPESLEVLAVLEREGGVSVARLGTNAGVGHALNLGVKRARELGCAWLLTMDQDSVADGGMIAAYRAALEQNPRWACLTPRIADHGRDEAATAGVVAYAITSGNLVRVDLFDRVGSYDEGFFIDCIDFDFCLRLRRAGCSVHRVPGAVMQHQLGEPVGVPDFVRKIYALHPPARRYYATRNYLYLAERHVLCFPWFIVKLGLLQLLLLVLVGFLDPRPLESYRAIGRGILDYLARRGGPYAGCTQ
jgi:rhamnosyltransferase